MELCWREMEGKTSRGVVGLHVLGGFAKPFCTGALLVCVCVGGLLALTVEQRTAVCHHETMASLKHHQPGSSVVEEACDPST